MVELLVCGSRSIKDSQFVFEKLDYIDDKLSQMHRERKAIKVLHHGGAVGVDSIAGNYAAINHIEITEHPIPEWVWEHLGRKAGPIRNKYMVEQVDRVVAIWDGDSAGTKSTIDYAENRDVPVDKVIVDVDDSGYVEEVHYDDLDHDDQKRIGDF